MRILSWFVTIPFHAREIPRGNLGWSYEREWDCVMARILILFTAQRDRQLLTQLLQSQYQVSAPDHPFSHPLTDLAPESDSDLILVDGPLLELVQPSLQARLDHPDQRFPPVLALLPRINLRALPETLWNSLDEVLTLPIEQRELLNRIGVLLRTQQLSCHLDRANQRLQQQNGQLQEMNRLKSQFVSMVSHEFRNPLGAVMGFAQLMQQTGDRISLEQKQDYLQGIIDSAQHLNGLVEDVMMFGHAGAGKLSFQPQVLDLSLFLHRLVGEIRFSQSASQPIELRLPEGEEIPLLFLDSNLLRHILINVLSNALKYSPDSAPVELFLTLESGQLCLMVQDQGIGISEADQAKMFEPFYRASNVGEVKGTGLGLAIAQQCAQLHQGSLKLESQLDLGTRVTLTLPLKLAPCS